MFEMRPYRLSTCGQYPNITCIGFNICGRRILTNDVDTGKYIIFKRNRLDKDWSRHGFNESERVEYFLSEKYIDDNSINSLSDNKIRFLKGENTMNGAELFLWEPAYRVVFAMLAISVVCVEKTFYFFIKRIKKDFKEGE